VSRALEHSPSRQVVFINNKQKLFVDPMYTDKVREYAHERDLQTITMKRLLQCREFAFELLFVTSCVFRGYPFCVMRFSFLP